MPQWWGPAVSGLTTRGRSFLAAGAAAAACAILLNQRDLLRVAVLLGALPIACAITLARSRYRLSLTRTITPPRVTAGDVARVRLELANLTRLSTRTLMAEDQVPYALGSTPRFVLDRLPGGRSAAVGYSLRSQVRGRYPVGPLRLHLADPFGLCELTRSFTATDTLVVVPRVWPLDPLVSGGMWAGSGESLARSAAASGEDDVATREYREGDDLRRVHWRSTAKRGELMVRREEQPRQMRASVVLDTRPGAHRGEGPASSFEWAVSAAASAAVHLAELGFAVRVVTGGGDTTWTAPMTAQSGVLLDQLADVQTGTDHDLREALSVLLRSGGDGLVVAVLGEVDDDNAHSLARLVREGTPGVALLLRTTQWATLPPGRRAAVEGQQERVAQQLALSGWRLGQAGPTDTPTSVWPGSNARAADALVGSGANVGSAANGRGPV